MSTNVYLCQHHQTKLLREQFAKLKSAEESLKFGHTTLQNELASTQRHLYETMHELKTTEAHVKIEKTQIILVSQLEKAHNELGAARVLYVTRLPDLSPYSANMLKDRRTQ